MRISDLAEKIENACASLLEIYTQECTQEAKNASLTNELEQALNRLRSPKHEIGVIGLQGHGKSTLVNALLGETLTYAGAEIATNSIARIEWGEPHCEVLTRTKKGTKKRKVYPLSIFKDLGRRGGIPVKSGSEIVAYTHSQFLKDGVCLVDTPGADAGIGAEADNDIIDSYLKNAHVVLIATVARTPGLERFYHLLERTKQNGSSIVVALTMSDLLDEDEVEESILATRRQLRSYCNTDVPLFAVSARYTLFNSSANWNEAQDCNPARDGSGALDSNGILDENGTLEMNRLKAHLQKLALDTRLNCIACALSIFDKIANGLCNTIEETVKSQEAKIADINTEICKSNLQLAEQHKLFQKAMQAIKEMADLVMQDIEEYLKDQWTIIYWKLTKQQGTTLTANSICSSPKWDKLVSRITYGVIELLDEFIEVARMELECIKLECIKVDSRHPVHHDEDSIQLDEIFPKPGEMLSSKINEYECNFSSDFNFLSYSLSTKILNNADHIAQTIVSTCNLAIKAKESQLRSNLESLKKKLHEAEEDMHSEHCRAKDINNSLVCLNNQLLPVRAACSLRLSLVPLRCSDVIRVAQITKPEHLDGFASLVSNIRSIPQDFPHAPDEVWSFWAHIYTARHLFLAGEFLEACLQAEMAVELATVNHDLHMNGVQPDWRNKALMLYVVTLYKVNGHHAALAYLENHCMEDYNMEDCSTKDCVVEDHRQENYKIIDCSSGSPEVVFLDKRIKLALALLANRISLVRQLLSTGPDLFLSKCNGNNPDGSMSLLSILAAYVCSTDLIDCPAGTDNSIWLLHRLTYELNVPSNIEKMAHAVRFDSSIERHLAARINSWTRLKEEELCIIEQAYGEFGHSEHFLPASAVKKLESLLVANAIL